ncbi:MAG: MmcQ/YjbR family DNA-binding protein [Asticcacaulis sp.]
MLTNDRICEMALELPGTERGTAWGQPVVKAGGKSLFFWNPKHGPVFFVDFDQRDFWIEVDPDTFFTTDHHRGHPCVLARPERVPEDWVRERLKESWRDKAPAKLRKSIDPSLLP